MAHISMLSPDLLKNIAFRLLPDYLVDYFHFRAVCRDWRSCTPDPQDFAFCFCPLHWVMVLQNASRANSTEIRHFSHLPTGRGAVVSLPEHMTHSILADIDGFLVLIDKRTDAMRLFNPFNRYLSEDLPTILRNVNDAIVYHLQSKRIECTGLELGHLCREVFSFLYYGPISIDLHIFNYRKYRSSSRHLKVPGDVLSKWDKDGWRQVPSS